MCRRLSERLNKAGYETEALHGDIPQSKRNQVMNHFKRGKFPILVCTDVAARGIDVDDVEAVINYDLPNENEYYVHRIGRTGRAKKHGVSYTFCATITDEVKMDQIVKNQRYEVHKLKFDEDGCLMQVE
jgi:ATP-dependent RNA helicase DeaD